MSMKSLPLQASGTLPEVGRRLRSLRLGRHLTMDQVADAAGCSKGFLSRLERGLASPSVATLVTLCQVIGVSAGDVLDTPELAVVGLAEAPQVHLGGEGIREHLLTPPSQRGLKIIRAEIAPGGAGEADLYTMDCETESLHVLSGELTLITAERRWDLTAGDTATFPGTEAHTWANEGEQDAVVLWILSGHRGS